MKEAVLFDLDEVIVAGTEEWKAEARQEVIKERCGVDVGFDRSLIGLSGLEAMIGHLQAHNLHEDARELCRLQQERYFQFLQDRHIDSVPAAGELLEYVASRICKIGLVTGSHRPWTEIILRKLGFTEYFQGDHRITVCKGDYESPKPEPEPWLVAADRLLVLPSECVGIEDSVCGITSLRRAGCKAVGITTTAPEAALLRSGADLVVSSHQELILDSGLWLM